jgi:hypothetical protein
MPGLWGLNGAGWPEGMRQNAWRGRLAAWRAPKGVANALLCVGGRGEHGASGREQQGDRATFEAKDDGSPVAWSNRHLSTVRKRLGCCVVMTYR